MGKEKPARATPVTPEQVFLALGAAWQLLTGSAPERKIIHILHAQSALETGHWRSVMNYNLGGAKKHGECDWTYFTTTERFQDSTAQKYVASSKPGAEVTVLKTGDGWTTLKFSGKQQMNCFASWDDLDTAARDHLSLLFRRFPKAIERAKAGDVEGYVRELKKANYFTASEADYTKTVSSIAKSYEKRLLNVMLPTVVML